ncbi:uncharacterized protein LOC123307450 [Coccinella septempunctata]|uniref:uncharacterized protein LOC123307450 n=1 Tax=Coccinella septempunctata TaxID=41139 RepID=UPI001D091667|nr:uncharacterized protein LOC123307450 [Coccinella septempunctata]
MSKGFRNIILLICAVSLREVLGHGMMLEPPNRSSLWKYYTIDNDKVVPNYNDNQNFCGGYSTQWDTFDGKCGVCGDPYDAAHPQDNENTGLYGKFGPVRTYKMGEVVNVTILLTSNHKGHFTYSICVLDDPTKPESGEDCFQALKLENGSPRYGVSSTDQYVYNMVKLPEDLTCERCVLRWHYTAGNNWGWCTSTVGALGCGPQETFRSCSDIKIEK